MRFRMGLKIKYALLILSLVVLIVVLTSLMIGIFALRSGTKNLVDEIQKRFSLSLVNYQSLLEEYIFLNRGKQDIARILRNAAQSENVGFVMVNYEEDLFLLKTGMNLDIEYKGLDLRSIKQIENEPEKVKEVVFEAVYTKCLKQVIEQYKQEQAPRTITEKDFLFTIPTLLEEEIDSLDQMSKEQTGMELEKVEKIRTCLLRWNTFLHQAYQKVGKRYQQKEIGEEERWGLYLFLMRIRYLESKIYIFPKFNPYHPESAYIFYAPIFSLNPESQVNQYFGDILICYSFKEALNILEQQRGTLLMIVLFSIFFAACLGVAGSVFLASSIIRPIKKISKQVEIVSAAEDFEMLAAAKSDKIEINTGDEIELLASSINRMTHKLIEKSKTDKQLLLGKEVQKRFIPLDPVETDFIDIYGFYEGAKSVSGDYFDYKKLDEDHYAFIICDVAGKALPAALIMVEISAIFRSFFNNFKPGVSEVETISVVKEINDTIAQRGFPGRFASILVLILNVKTGKVYLTNAGYTRVLIYRSDKEQCEWVNLDDRSGAAGIFPSFMLLSPYRQEYLQVDHGDIIFLFSDGIEETRNGAFSIKPDGQKLYEEFGIERLVSSLNQVEQKKPRHMVEYILEREKEFRGENEQYDDITLLAIMRK